MFFAKNQVFFLPKEKIIDKNYIQYAIQSIDMKNNIYNLEFSIYDENVELYYF